jgi:hypothetical protein
MGACLYDGVDGVQFDVDLGRQDLGRTLEVVGLGKNPCPEMA